MRTSGFRMFFGFILFLIITLIALRATMVFTAMKSGKTMYQIDVNNFNNPESYLTTSYEKDEKTGCIKFKDEFGVKHIVCNSYSITQY